MASLLGAQDYKDSREMTAIQTLVARIDIYQTGHPPSDFLPSDLVRFPSALQALVKLTPNTQEFFIALEALITELDSRFGSPTAPLVDTIPEIDIYMAALFHFGTLHAIRVILKTSKEFPLLGLCFRLVQLGCCGGMSSLSRLVYLNFHTVLCEPVPLVLSLGSTALIAALYDSIAVMWSELRRVNRSETFPRSHLDALYGICRTRMPRELDLPFVRFLSSVAVHEMGNDTVLQGFATVAYVILTCYDAVDSPELTAVITKMLEPVFLNSFGCRNMICEAVGRLCGQINAYCNETAIRILELFDEMVSRCNAEQAAKLAMEFDLNVIQQLIDRGDRTLTFGTIVPLSVILKAGLVHPALLLNHPMLPVILNLLSGAPFDQRRMVVLLIESIVSTCSWTVLTVEIFEAFMEAAVDLLGGSLRETESALLGLLVAVESKDVVFRREVLAVWDRLQMSEALAELTPAISHIAALVDRIMNVDWLFSL
jgi:hypothetical protein